MRARFILTYIDDWLKRQSKKVVNEPSPRVVSFSKPLTYETKLASPIIGGVLVPGKQKRMPIHIQNTAPQTKSKAFMQQVVQKERMSTQGQDSNDGLNFSDNTDGDEQFIEAPKVDQPKFMTPTRDTHVVSISPTVPSWLSNLVSKKRSLQLVSTPVKDIVTKYATQGSKVKKLKLI